MSQPTETTVQETTQVTTTPAVETAQTPQQQARQQIQQQYDSLYTQPTAPVVDNVAPPVTQTVEPVKVEQEFDYKSIIAEQQAALTAMREELSALKPKPVSEPTPSAQAPEMQKWVELMAEGKYTEAQEFLVQVMTPAIQKQIQPSIVQQSVEATTAEQEINSFIARFEADNQDLLPMRDYVAMGAERLLRIAEGEGKIKSPADFAREYQKAVKDASNQLREKFQMARGAGKEEALTTRREVLSATTIEPSGIRPPQQQQQSPTSPSDYIAQRRERMSSIQGLR